MSLQICRCGWTKLTSYQGLRNHQRKKGCLPDGLSEGEILKINMHVRTLAYMGPSLSLSDPFMEILNTSNRPVPSRITIFDNSLQENTSSNQEIIPFSDMRARLPESTPPTGLVPQLTSLAALIQADETTPPVSPSASPPHVAREAETTKITETFTDDLQIGSDSAADAEPLETASVPGTGQAPSMFSGTRMNPVKTEASLEMSNPTLFQTWPKAFGTTTEASTFNFGSQQSSPKGSATKTSGKQTNPADKENKTKTKSETLSETPQKNTDMAAGAGERQVSATKTSGNQSNPDDKENKTKTTNPTVSETPQNVTDTTTGAGEQQNVFPNPSTPTSSPEIPVAREAQTPQTTQAFSDAQSNSAAESGASETSSASLSGQAPSITSGPQISGDQTNPANMEDNTEMKDRTLPQTYPQVFGTATSPFNFTSAARQNMSSNTSTPKKTTRTPEAREAETPQMTKPFSDSLQLGSNSKKNSGNPDITCAAQSSPKVSATKTLDNQTNPADKENKPKTTNQTLSETPQKVTDTVTANGARRALDFSTGTEQKVFQNTSTPTTSPKIPGAREAQTPQTAQAFSDAQSNSAEKSEASETASASLSGQAPSITSGPQISGNQTNPANMEDNTEIKDKTLPQTYPQVFGTDSSPRNFTFSAQQNNMFSNTPKDPKIPEAREAEKPHLNQTSPDARPHETASFPAFSQTPSMFSGVQFFGNSGMSNQTTGLQTSSQVFGTTPSFFGEHQSFNPNTSTPVSPPRIPEAREAEITQLTQTFSLPLGSNSYRDSATCGTTSAAQTFSTVSSTNIFENQTNPADKEVKTKTTNQTWFPTKTVTDMTTGAYQWLDSSTGEQQSWNIPTTTAQETVFRQKKTEKDRKKQSFSNSYTGAPGEVPCDVCTKPKLRAEKSCLMCLTSFCSTHLENHSTQRLKGHKLVDPVSNMDERACLQHGRPLELFSRKAGRCICVLCMKKDQEVCPIEVECNRRKATLENTKLHLREKIEKRITRIDEINESLKSCVDQLDNEENDIDAVFRAVIAIVEEAYAAALQPLKHRKQLVVQEAKDIEEKLEAEIEQLQQSISVLDEISALDDHILFLQTYPSLQDQDHIKDYPEGELDTSLSFGTMRKITGTMMESIQQELEKLTPIEIQRIPEFTVDVTLDPNTAHQCLEISDDGKEVKDSGENQKVPDSLERFDRHGSVLGLNRFTSGKYYWEVQVKNKTGWDLGVARGRANRKGKLSLTPDNGYWVTVHFDDEKYAALKVPPVPLSLEEKLQTVGVFVDYEEGLVSFYDVTAKSHIYSFTGCSFSGDILPYFSPHVKIGNKNVAPLVISSLRKM